MNKTVALQWPLAEAMAQACNNLGVRSVYEVRFRGAVAVERPEADAVDDLCSPRRLILRIGLTLVGFEYC